MHFFDNAIFSRSGSRGPTHAYATKSRQDGISETQSIDYADISARLRSPSVMDNEKICLQQTLKGCIAFVPPSHEASLKHRYSIKTLTSTFVMYASPMVLGHVALNTSSASSCTLARWT